MIGAGAHGAVASAYPKQVGTIPYTTLWQDMTLPPWYEGRRIYNGTGNGNFEDFVMTWPGGNQPGYRLQFWLGAFMEATPPGINYIGLSIGGVWVIDIGLQEPPGGGGRDMATGWIDVAQSYTGAMYVLNGTNFADNAHFKFVDVYYRYVRS